MKVLAQLDEDCNLDSDYFIHANYTGIYYCNTWSGDRIHVRHFDFKGNLVSEYHFAETPEDRDNYGSPAESAVKVVDLYFYDNYIYFLYSKENEEDNFYYSENQDNEKKYELRRIDVDNKRMSTMMSICYKDTEEEVRDNVFIFANEVILENMYGFNESHLIGANKYKAVVEIGKYYFLSIDLKSGNIDTLSHILDQERNYEKTYLDNVLFDLTRGVYWVERKRKDSDEYLLVPKFIWGKDAGKMIDGRDGREMDDIYIWKLPKKLLRCNNRPFFDGNIMYGGEGCYPEFWIGTSSVEFEAKEYLENDGHGSGAFFIIGSYFCLKNYVRTPKLYYTDSALMGETDAWFEETEMLKYETREKVEGLIEKYRNM